MLITLLLTALEISIGTTQGDQIGGNCHYTSTQNGTVFKLTPPAVGKSTWTQTRIFTFNYTNGADPSGLVFDDSTGTLYGVTAWGGLYGWGTAFKLTPPATGKTAWTHETIANFGSGIALGLSIKNGSLYGIIQSPYQGSSGAVFKVAHPATGKTS